jgi:hypothetical protein
VQIILICICTTFFTTHPIIVIIKTSTLLKLKLTHYLLKFLMYLNFGYLSLNRKIYSLKKLIN